MQNYRCQMNGQSLVNRKGLAGFLMSIATNIQLFGTLISLLVETLCRVSWTVISSCWRSWCLRMRYNWWSSLEYICWLTDGDERLAKFGIGRKARTRFPGFGHNIERVSDEM